MFSFCISTQIWLQSSCPSICPFKFDYCVICVNFSQTHNVIKNNFVQGLNKHSQLFTLISYLYTLTAYAPPEIIKYRTREERKQQKIKRKWVHFHWSSFYHLIFFFCTEYQLLRGCWTFEMATVLASFFFCKVVGKLFQTNTHLFDIHFSPSTTKKKIFCYRSHHCFAERFSSLH